MAHQKSGIRKSHHIVVAVAVITDKQNRVLTCLRNDPHNQKFHLCWEFPGGTIRRGETIESGLVREVKEELGCDIKILEVIPHVRLSQIDGDRKNLSIFVLSYHAVITAGEIICDGREVLEYRWVTEKELPELPTLPGMSEIVKTLFTNQKNKKTKNQDVIN